jgi:hypothetical protein
MRLLCTFSEDQDADGEDDADDERNGDVFGRVPGASRLDLGIPEDGKNTFGDSKYLKIN